MRTCREVIRSSNHILALGESNKQYIQVEGGREQGVSVLPPLARTKFFYSEEGRSRFRQYIGLDPNSYLAYSDLLGGRQDAELALYAIKSFLRKNPIQSSRFKALLRIDGKCDDVNYLASDMGIASNILLLNQEIDLFSVDLYSAIDICFSPLGLRKDVPPQWLVEAAACGACSIEGAYWGDGFVHLNSVLCEGSDFGSLGDSLGEALKLLKFKAPNRLGFGKGKVLEEGEKYCSEVLELLKTVRKGYVMGSETSQVEFESLRCQLEDSICLGVGEDLDDQFEALTVLADSDLKLKSVVLRLKGEYLLKSGNLESAMEALEESVQADASNWKSFLNLGKISIRMHSEEDAITFYKKVLALKPNHAQALAGVGTVHRMLGMCEDAVYWFHRALSLDMSNEKLLFDLTQAMLECDEIDDSILVLESLRECIGDKQCVVMALGQMLMRAGRIEEGRLMVAKGLDDSPSYESEQALIQD